jgi:hypothetical protein
VEFNELDNEQVEKLHQIVERGDIVDSFVKHDGFKILKSWLDNKITDSRNEWLKVGTKDLAEEVRLKSKTYLEVFSFLNSLVIKANEAKKILQSSENTISE